MAPRSTSSTSRSAWGRPSVSYCRQFPRRLGEGENTRVVNMFEESRGTVISKKTGSSLFGWIRSTGGGPDRTDYPESVCCLSQFLLPHLSRRQRALFRPSPAAGQFRLHMARSALPQELRAREPGQVSLLV